MDLEASFQNMKASHYTLCQLFALVSLSEFEEINSMGTDSCSLYAFSSNRFSDNG
jgi:hypothetical protein